MRRMVIASLREVCVGEFAEAASGLEAIEQLTLGPVALMVERFRQADSSSSRRHGLGSCFQVTFPAGTGPGPVERG